MREGRRGFRPAALRRLVDRHLWGWRRRVV